MWTRISSVALGLGILVGCGSEDTVAGATADTGMAPVGTEKATAEVEVTGGSTWSGTLTGTCTVYRDEPTIVPDIVVDLTDGTDAYQLFHVNPASTGATWMVVGGEVDAGTAFATYISETETTTVTEQGDGSFLLEATGTRQGVGSESASWQAVVRGCVEGP